MFRSRPTPPESQLRNENIVTWLSNLKDRGNCKAFLQNPAVARMTNQAVQAYLNGSYAPNCPIDLKHLEMLFKHGFYLDFDSQKVLWDRCKGRLAEKPFMNLCKLLFLYGQLACRDPVEWGRRFICLYQPEGGAYQTIRFDCWLPVFFDLRGRFAVLNSPDDAINLVDAIDHSCVHAVDRLKHVIVGQSRPAELLAQLKRLLDPSVLQHAHPLAIGYWFQATDAMMGAYQSYLHAKSSIKLDFHFWGNAFVGCFKRLNTKSDDVNLQRLFQSITALSQKRDWLHFWMHDYPSMDQDLFVFLLDHLIGVDDINQPMILDGRRIPHLLIHLIRCKNVAGVLWLIKWAELRRVNLCSQLPSYAFDFYKQESTGLDQAIHESHMSPDDKAYALIFTALSNALIDRESFIYSEVGDAVTVGALSVKWTAATKNSVKKNVSFKANRPKQSGWKLSDHDRADVSTVSKAMQASAAAPQSRMPIYVSSVASPRKHSGPSSASPQKASRVSMFTFDDAACQQEQHDAMLRHRVRSSVDSHSRSASSHSMSDDESDATPAPISPVEQPARLSNVSSGEAMSAFVVSRKRANNEAPAVRVTDDSNRASKRARSVAEKVLDRPSTLAWSINPSYESALSNVLVLFRGVHFHHGQRNELPFSLPQSPAVRDGMAHGASYEEAVSTIRHEFSQMSDEQAAAFHCVYSNTYDKMAKALANEKTCREYFGAHFSSHPYVSFANLDTAVAYMQGSKFSGRECKTPRLPNYNRTGEPRQRVAGFIQCCVVAPDQADYLRSCMIAYAKGQPFDHRIVAEGEVSAIAGFDGQVYAEQSLVYPSFKGPYTQAADKSGLSAERYAYYQSELCRDLTDDAREQIERSLLGELSSLVRKSGVALREHFSDQEHFFALASEPGKAVFTDRDLPLSLARVLYHYHHVPSDLLGVVCVGPFDQDSCLDAIRRMISAHAKTHHPHYGHMLRFLNLLSSFKDSTSLEYLQALDGYDDLKRWVKQFESSRLRDTVVDLLAASTQYHMGHLSEEDLKWLAAFLERYPDPSQPVATLSNASRGVLQKWLLWDVGYWFHPLVLKFDAGMVESIRSDLTNAVYPRGRHPDAEPGALLETTALKVCPVLESFKPWSIPYDAVRDDAMGFVSDGAAAAAASSHPVQVPAPMGSSVSCYQWFIQAIQSADVMGVSAYLRWVTREAVQRYAGNPKAAIRFASSFLVGETVARLSDAKQYPSPLLYAAGYEAKEGVDPKDRDAVFSLLFDQRILDTEFSAVSEDDQGNRMSHWAVNRHATSILHKIFRRHPHYKSTLNQEGHTPLHLACKLGYLDAVKLLVQHGEVVCYDGQGKTPLDLARESGHESVVQWLAPLHECIHQLHLCFQSSYNLLNHIKKFDIAPFVRAIDVLTHSPVYITLFKQYAESVRSNPPWSVNAPHLQKSIAFLAVEANHLSLVDALLRCGIRINHRPQRYQGRSFLPAFVLAVQKGFVPLVQCVLSYQPTALLSTQQSIVDVVHFDWSTLDVIVFAKKHPTQSAGLCDVLLTTYHKHRHDVITYLQKECKGFSQDLVMPKLDDAFETLKGSALQRHGLLAGSNQGGVKQGMKCQPK